MANLITEKQKKAIKFDYIVRFFSVSLILLSILGVFLLVYITPYYISLSKKEAQVALQFEAMVTSENKRNIGASATEIVSKTLDEMRAVELYNPSQPTPSVYFAKIIESKNSNISLTKLSLNSSKKGEIQFLVSGVSLDREGLVSFIEDLKTKGGFASVESPVSDFAKDKNISFALNVIAKI